MKIIAAYINSDNKIVTLEDEGYVKIFCKEKDNWSVLKEFKFSLKNVKTIKEMRDCVSELINKLGECRTFVAKDVVGQLYYILEANGFNIYEIDGNIDEVLEIVLESENKELEAQESKVLKTKLPKPELDCEGVHNIDLSKVLFENPQITSKQILLDFIKEKNFKILNIYCSHIPKWINSFIDDERLRIVENKIGENKYNLIISKEE